jgi:putative ABC transport system permease protein
LGIGISTAVLSLSAAMLLTPLSFPESDRLVMLHASNDRGRFGNELSYLDFDDIRSDRGPLSDVAAALRYSGTLLGRSEPVRVTGFEVTPNFLAVLRVEPALGRSFVAAEGEPGAGQVTVLSDRLWRTAFGGDPGIVGTQVRLDEVPYTVIGVLPADFSLELDTGIDLFVPTNRDHPLARSRAIYTYQVIGRLENGATLDQVRASLDTKGRQLAAAYPETNARRRFTAVPLLDEIVGDVRTPLRLMSFAIAAVLLLVCANVANLLLTRATWRRREMGVRAALGARRARLVRQMLIESVLLASIGGAAGMTLAYWLHTLLVRSNGAAIPRIDTPLGLPLMIIGVSVTIATGLLIGAGPALLASQPGSADVLRDARSTPPRSAIAFSRALVIFQTGAAVVLVSAAAVLASSLAAVLRAPGGFDATDGIALRVALPLGRYQSRAAIAAFFTKLAEEARRLPSVRHAGVASALPLSGQDAGSALSIFGQPKPLNELPSVRWQLAAPGYFTAMGIPILRGRDYSPDDLERSHVSIVSEAVERQFFPGQSAVGRRIYCGLPSKNHADWHEVIGVVGDVRHRRLDLAPEPRVYDLLGQHADETAFLVVRSSEPAVLPQVRSIVHEIDPALAIYQVSTLEDMAARSVAPRRFLAALIGGAALLASMIAAVGVYGVMSYSVARRRQEFGVRLALGAAPHNLTRLVARQGILLALAGSLVGAVCAALLAPVLASQVYGAGGAHATALATGAALFVIAAAVASYLPARRAGRVDPLITLRDV